MKNLLNVIARVGSVFVKSGDKFDSAPNFNIQDPSYHDVIDGADDVIVTDDGDRNEWYARLDLHLIKDDDYVTNLISSALGAPSRVHPNGARNWDVDGVLVVYLKGGIEFIESYDKVSRR